MQVNFTPQLHDGNARAGFGCVYLKADQVCSPSGTR
jgi:hypothetical protein